MQNDDDKAKAEKTKAFFKYLHELESQLTKAKDMSDKEKADRFMALTSAFLKKHSKKFN